VKGISHHKRCISNLAYTKIAGDDSQPPLVILHGLLGSKNNWRGISKALNKNVTPKTIYTVDARNHGDSPHHAHMDYLAMADDLVSWMDSLEMDTACLMGHSMGGRTAMAVALNHPSRVDRLVALDISPHGASSAISTVVRFVEALLRVPLAGLTLPQARQAADKALLPHVPDAAIRAWLLTNLTTTPSGAVAWRVNLRAVSRCFNPHISAFPLAACRYHLFDGCAAFVGGAKSDYIRREEHPHIAEVFPRASFSYVAGAGHWLHADRPVEFLQAIAPHVC